MIPKKWSKTCPKKPGKYLLKCDEGGFVEEIVGITLIGDILMAHTSAFPSILLKDLHNGLTSVTWCFVGSGGVTPEQIAKSGTEHGLQSGLFAWTHLPETKQRFPELDTKLLFAIPNGGQRDKITGNKLKLEGVKAGVPDIFLSVARGGWFGFYIEMKKKNEKPSSEQLKFKAQVEPEGYLWAYFDSWEQARDALIWYMSLDRTKIHG